ncbi:ligand-binding domain of nuclear hormone receptor domain-containing protein [Ditylenchus destructor]|uniref:Ligand-binding domain of nuclear hormone receptor domain-containing protein n=1 Tax=Ditylenchus destructor TaxID=166010 RepID=A0AAD4MEY8_9BILA|nr:ligand-binding domain of nuclear hormone receptor domain-containing protein [Ditylenchus destructor]
MNHRAIQFPASVDVAKLSDKVENRRTGLVFEETIEDKLIQSLVYVELKVRQIRESSRWLRESVILQGIREVLSNHENVLAHADQYPKELSWPLTIDEAVKLEASEGRPKWLMLDIFLCIEIARTMSAFLQLDYHDQEALLKQAILANALLLEAFYSWQMKSETLIMPIVLSKNYGSKRITNRMMLISCRTMAAMSRIQMTMEEFVLLRAIIYSHSAIHGLSERGRVLLEKESIRYSRTLMKHLQSRMGAASGAKKYAEIVSFVGCLFHGALQLREMSVYPAGRRAALMLETERAATNTREYMPSNLANLADLALDKDRPLHTKEAEPLENRLACVNLVLFCSLNFFSHCFLDESLIAMLMR